MTARIVGQCARDRDALLFAAGKMPAWPGGFVAETDRLEQLRGAFPHFAFR